MRSCGSLSDTRAREVEGVGAVGLIVSSNGGVRLTFMRAEYLGTLEVRTTNTKFVSARHVEEDLLQDSGVTCTLSMTLSASKLEFFFARVIATNATLKKLMVRHNLEEGSIILIHSSHV
jgi:hypothetical protein